VRYFLYRHTGEGGYPVALCTILRSIALDTGFRRHDEFSLYTKFIELLFLLFRCHAREGGHPMDMAANFRSPPSR
jgi:hypothetical protein